MKKNILLITFFLSLNYCIGQNNKGIITYKKEVVTKLSGSEKSARLKKNNPILYKRMLIIEENTLPILEEMRFHLIFEDSKSVFKVGAFLELQNERFYKFALGPLGSSVYYTDLKKEEQIIEKDAYGEKFLVTMPKRKWITSNETKKIGDYICYKATTVDQIKGRKGIVNFPIIGWYCPQINIPVGPLGYGGLPGLIMELEIRNEKYVAIKIDLNPIKRKIKIRKPNVGIEVTKEEFEDIGIKTMGDFKKSIGN